MKRVKFQWKLDPVALAALILSMFAAGSQAVAWALGPSIRFIAPDRIALYSDIAPDGSIFVRVASHMSYANVAQAPYGDLVLKERVQLRVGTLTSRQQWNAFGTITREGPRMTEPAAPQPLPGQSAVSHFTLFAPTSPRCALGSRKCNPKQQYLSPEALVERVGIADRLRLTFEIDLIDGGLERTSCDVPLTPETKRAISNLATSYAYLHCYPDEAA